MATTAPSRRSARGEAGKRFRGPFARWPRTADAVLAVLHLLFVTLLEEGPGDTMTPRDLPDVPIWVLIVFAVSSAALWWRRSRPFHVVGVGVASMAVLLGSGFADTGLVAILGLYAVGRHTTDDVRGELAVLAVAIVFVLDGTTDNLALPEVAFAIAVAVGAWLLGRGNRLRDERGQHALREQQAERQRILAEERTRIARELHDVVAHRVSLMTVQAGAAATVLERDPAAARQAMQAVEVAGRQALDELRHLLGVLRPEAEEAARHPQPGLEDLPRLVEDVRRAGLDVELSTSGTLEAATSAATQLSAHRIVQESLTNVLKHAGEGARATVDVRVDDTAVVVDVVDDGGGRRAPGTPSGTGGGHGIVGMRERATLLGGTLQAGPTANGGFRVQATLPVQPTTTSTSEQA